MFKISVLWKKGQQINTNIGKTVNLNNVL